MDKHIFLLLGIIAVLIVSGCASLISSGTDGQPSMDGDAKVYVPAETPREAFEAYRMAIEDGDYVGFKKSVPDRIVRTMEKLLPGRMTEENFRQVFSMMNAFMVPTDDVLIVDETSGDGWTNWTVSDRSDPKSTGTISFLKEADGWKVLREEWKSGL